MTWLVLALLAPLFWAIGNFVDKYSIEHITIGIFDYLAFSTITAWIFVPILLWWFGLPTLSTLSIVPVLLGMALLYSFGFYARGLAEGETSRLVVLHMLIPLLTLALAYVFLGQQLTLVQVLAFILILVGSSVVSVDKLTSNFLMAPGVKWTYVAIVMWSVIFVLADFTLSRMPFADFIVLDALGTGVALFPMLAVSPWRREIMDGIRSAMPAKYGWFVFNNSLDLLAQITFKRSISLAPSVGLVTVVLQVQSFYAIALGALLTSLLPRFIKEDLSSRNILKKMLGAAVMFLGVYLLF